MKEGIFQAYIRCWTKDYCHFSGRERRSVFWLFLLLSIIFGLTGITFGLLLDNLMGLQPIIAVPVNIHEYLHGQTLNTVRDLSVGPLTVIFYVGFKLAMIVPSICIYARRLHDTNRSFVWFLIAFVPLVGPIWLLILLCTKGTTGHNDFGEDTLQ